MIPKKANIRIFSDPSRLSINSDTPLVILFLAVLLATLAVELFLSIFMWFDMVILDPDRPVLACTSPKHTVNLLEC